MFTKPFYVIPIFLEIKAMEAVPYLRAKLTLFMLSTFIVQFGANSVQEIWNYLCWLFASFM
jgi:hypothetical protein